MIVFECFVMWIVNVCECYLVIVYLIGEVEFEWLCVVCEVCDVCLFVVMFVLFEVVVVLNCGVCVLIDWECNWIVEMYCEGYVVWLFSEMVLDMFVVMFDVCVVCIVW